MEVLLGLGLATLLIYGWSRASVLVAIFLTLGELLGMGFIGLYRSGDPTLQKINLALIILIWLPVAVRLCRVSAKDAPAPPPARAPLSLTINTLD